METSNPLPLVDVQMVEIIERISEIASGDTTISPDTKSYELLGNTIYVRPHSRFLKYVIRFCNAHADFMNTKPDHRKIDEVLFGNSFDAIGFIAIGRAYRLFDSMEIDGKVVITGYTKRDEPFV